MGMTQTTTTDAHRIQPWHEVHDAAKCSALVESLAENGWIGAPVVVIERVDADPQAITGSHRIAAAREAGIDVPTIDLAELLAEHGADLNALIADYEAAGLEREDATYEVIVRVNEHLPADVAEFYGLDAH